MLSSYILVSHFVVNQFLDVWCLGETLSKGIQSVHVLLSDEALLLIAEKEFDDTTPQGIPCPVSNLYLPIIVTILCRGQG